MKTDLETEYKRLGTEVKAPGPESGSTKWAEVGYSIKGNEIHFSLYLGWEGQGSKSAIWSKWSKTNKLIFISACKHK